jgi:hypothetical protein
MFSFAEAKNPLTDIANEVIYMEDLEALNALENQIDVEDVKKALTDVENRGTISLNAIKHKHKL